MAEVANVLQAFVASLTSHATEFYDWPLARFKVNTYLHSEPPPAEFVTSVRALVLRDDEVLLVRDPSSYHILPGGRREAGETYHQTVVRELLEETGWRVEIGRLLGFKHFYRLTPKPAEIAYPHPDFAQLIYLASPVIYQPEAKEQNGYELGSEFVPLTGLDQAQITWSERLFLQAACASGKTIDTGE